MATETIKLKRLRNSPERISPNDIKIEKVNGLKRFVFSDNRSETVGRVFLSIGFPLKKIKSGLADTETENLFFVCNRDEYGYFLELLNTDFPAYQILEELVGKDANTLTKNDLSYFSEVQGADSN